MLDSEISFIAVLTTGHSEFEYFVELLIFESQFGGGGVVPM